MQRMQKGQCLKVELPILQHSLAEIQVEQNLEQEESNLTEHTNKRLGWN